MPVIFTTSAFSTTQLIVDFSELRISGGVALKRMLRGGCPPGGGPMGATVTRIAVVAETSPNLLRAVKVYVVVSFGAMRAVPFTATLPTPARVTVSPFSAVH